jgi:hypothetical protein
MKTLVTALIALMFAIQVQAQSTASATYFTQEGEKIWVIVDGIKQNNVASTNVKVSGLTKQAYRVKLIFEDENLKPVDHNLYVQDPDGKMMEVVHNIRKNKKGEYVVRISSFDEVKGQTPPPATNGSQPAQTPPQEVPFHNQEWSDTQYNENVNMNMGIGGFGINTNVGVTETTDGGVNMDMSIGMPGMENMNMNTNVGVTGSTTTTVRTSTTTTTTTTGGSRPATTTPPANQTRPQTPVQQTPVTTPARPVETPAQPATPSNGCARTADNTAIANITNSIKSKSFAADKLKTAETFLKGSCVTTAQVKNLVSLFNFEADKLSFAKAAYSRCVDKENYYMVADDFSFSSSSEELMDYINAQ